MAVLLIKGLALSLLLPSTPPQHEPLNRRSVLQQTGAAAAALALAPLAANADVRGVNQDVPTDERGVNNLLKSQGFSTMKVPGGFSPLVQYIGTAPPANIDGFKSRERAFGSTLLVRFMFRPAGWSTRRRSRRTARRATSARTTTSRAIRPTSPRCRCRRARSSTR